MSEKAIIGLSSDEFAASREKTNHNKYDKKAENLQTIITKKFPEKSYIIAKLDSDFGPAVLENAR